MVGSDHWMEAMRSPRRSAASRISAQCEGTETASLIATVRRGREKLHILNPVPLQQIYERWIAKFEQPRLKALDDLKRKLENPHG